MGGKDERIKRPGRREEVEASEVKSDSVPRGGIVKRRHLVAPQPVTIVTEGLEATARMPRDIAEDVKFWCKSHLRINEKIHRDDLWRAIKLTPEERERWNGACFHLRTGDGALAHISKGFWKRAGADTPRFERRVRESESPRHVGRLIIGGVSIPFINKDGFEVSASGKVAGLKIIVPHTAGSEPLTVMDDLFELAANVSPGYKTPAVYEVIGKEYSPGSRRPGARRRGYSLSRERVIRTRLLGMWVATKKANLDESTTTYVVVYDEAEKI